MASENEVAPKVLVMDRGTVGDEKRLLAGEGYAIGDEVSQETAKLMVKRGRGHYASRKPARQPRAAAAAGDQ